VAASPRPSTAPAASSVEHWSSTTPVVATLVASPEEDEDDLSDCNEDPEPLLENASTTLYSLQNSWRDERRAELGRLCRDLEASYGLKPAAELLDEILALRPESSDVTESSAAGGMLAVDSPEAAEPEPEADAGETRSPEEEELDSEADAICAAAAQQLESVKELRRQLKECRQTPVGDAADSRVLFPAEAATAAGDMEGAADQAAKRLAALRWEVDKLKVKATEPTEQSLLHIAECQDQIRAEHGDVLQTKPISELTALDDWIQGMKKFCRDTAGTAAGPAQLPRARASPACTPSRQAMAQIAEARATEWAAQQEHEGSCRSPSSGSPTAHLHAAKPQRRGCSPKKASSLLSPTASSTGRATVATPLNGRVSVSPSSGAKEEKSAVEQQLDEILHEFDEIDRIHSHVCELVRA